MLLLSLIVLKLIASIPFDSAGMIGGVMFRNNPQLMVENHLCCFTSEAPDEDPNLLCSSLVNSFRIADLHKLSNNQLTS